jgi:hypothetical protein
VARCHRRSHHRRRTPSRGPWLRSVCARTTYVRSARADARYRRERILTT